MRKLTIYPADELRSLVLAECALTNLSPTDVISDALDKYYIKMPVNKMNKIKAKMKSMDGYPRKQA